MHLVFKGHAFQLGTDQCYHVWFLCILHFIVLFSFFLQVYKVGLFSFIVGYELLLRTVAHILSFLATVEACGGAPISWGRYVSFGRGSSSLSPVVPSSSSPVIGGTTSAEVHGYWDIVHGWGCICGVIILRVASLLVVVLPVILEEGLSGLVVEALGWGASCKALF